MYVRTNSLLPSPSHCERLLADPGGLSLWCHALTNVDVVRGGTSFVALKIVVLALITIFPKSVLLLTSLTKVDSVPPSVFTVTGLGRCPGAGAPASVAPRDFRLILFLLDAENSLIWVSWRSHTDLMLSEIALPTVASQSKSSLLILQ